MNAVTIIQPGEEVNLAECHAGRAHGFMKVVIMLMGAEEFDEAAERKVDPRRSATSFHTPALGGPDPLVQHRADALGAPCSPSAPGASIDREIRQRGSCHAKRGAEASLEPWECNVRARSSSAA